MEPIALAAAIAEEPDVVISDEIRAEYRGLVASLVPLIRTAARMDPGGAFPRLRIAGYGDAIAVASTQIPSLAEQGWELGWLCARVVSWHDADTVAPRVIIVEPVVARISRLFGLPVATARRYLLARAVVHVMQMCCVGWLKDERARLLGRWAEREPGAVLPTPGAREHTLLALLEGHAAQLALAACDVPFELRGDWWAEGSLAFGGEQAARMSAGVAWWRHVVARRGMAVANSIWMETGGLPDPEQLADPEQWLSALRSGDARRS